MMNYSEAVAGAIVKTDGSFTCIGKGVKRTVQVDAEGELFIRCSEGKHYLCGQLVEDERLFGLTLVSSPT